MSRSKTYEEELISEALWHLSEMARETLHLPRTYVQLTVEQHDALLEIMEAVETSITNEMKDKLYEEVMNKISQKADEQDNVNLDVIEDVIGETL